ncbi:MAG: hypothetical protein Q9205_006575 [Flavoplaca limonia]
MPVGLLHGLPGLGKTQVCLKYIKALRESHPWIWLVNAESQRSLNHDYAGIASDLGLRSTNDFQGQASAQDREQASQLEKTVGEMVKKKLEKAKVQWVLIFDNFQSTGIEEFCNYLPNSRYGIVLACAPDLAARIAIDPNFVYDVPKLGDDHLENIFWTDMQIERSDDDSSKATFDSARTLIKTLEQHTLSVHLAGNYIGQESGFRPTQKDIDTYIAALKHTGGGLPSQLPDILGPLWQSFKLSIGKLQRKNEQRFKDAIELLRLNTLYSQSYLPRRLFEEAIDRSNHGFGFLTSRPRWRKTEQVLVSWGLLVVETRGQEHGTSMLQVLHRCAGIGMWTEEGTSGSKLAKWRLAIRILGESVPSTSRQEDLDFRRLLVPHIDACLGNCKDPSSLLLDGTLEIRTAVEMLLSFSRVYLESGRFEGAKSFQSRASIKAEAAFGPLDELTISSKREHALSLDILGDSSASLQLRKRVYEDSLQKCRVEVLDGSPDDNPWIAEHYYGATADLAISYSRHVAHRKEALELRQRILEFSKAASSSSSPSEADRTQLLKAKRDYATSLFDFDRRKEALQLREEVSASLNDEEDGFAWNARRELVVSLTQTGQLLRARDLAEKILTDRTKKVGDDHPTTCVALATLAAVHIRSQENEQALQSLDKVIEKSTTIWGRDHLMTQHVLIDYAVVLAKMRKTRDSALEDATNTQREVLSVMTRNRGPEDYEVLKARVQMARMIQYYDPGVAQKQLSEVIHVLQRYGDPYCAVIQLKQVDCLIALGERQEAADILRTMDTGQGDVTTMLELKRLTKLATVYFDIAEAPDHSLDGPIASFSASSQEPGDDTSSVSENGASVTSGTPKSITSSSSVKTLEVTPKIVYHEFTREHLFRMSCDLRKQVVQHLEPAGGVGYHGAATKVIDDHFTAQACHNLAKSYARDSLFLNAISMQKRVFLYYEQYWGHDHTRTQYHHWTLDEWMDEGSSMV